MRVVLRLVNLWTDLTVPSRMFFLRFPVFSAAYGTYSGYVGANKRCTRFSGHFNHLGFIEAPGLAELVLITFCWLLAFVAGIKKDRGDAVLPFLIFNFYFTKFEEFTCMAGANFCDLL